MFPPRAPFFFQVRLGSAEELARGNLPVPPKPPPRGGDQNATTHAAVISAFSVATGSRTFHPKRISWS